MDTRHRLPAILQAAPDLAAMVASNERGRAASQRSARANASGSPVAYSSARLQPGGRIGGRGLTGLNCSGSSASPGSRIRESSSSQKKSRAVTSSGPDSTRTRPRTTHSAVS